MSEASITNAGYELRETYQRVRHEELNYCVDFIEAFVENPEIYTTLSQCYEMKMQSDQLDYDEGWGWMADNDIYAYKYWEQHHATHKWECVWDVIVDAHEEWRYEIWRDHQQDMVVALACYILLFDYDMKVVEPAKMEALLKIASVDWSMDDWKQGIERVLFNGGKSNE